MKLNARLFGFLSLLLITTSAAQENIWQGRFGTLAEPLTDYEEGLFPYDTSYYEFSENGTGTHYHGSDVGSGETGFQYSVTEQQQVLITDRELWTINVGYVYDTRFPPRQRIFSNFYYDVVETWGQEVADRMEDCEEFHSWHEWRVTGGIESEEWDIISDVDGIVALEIIQSHVQTLEVPEYIINDCPGWDIEASYTVRKTLPTVTRYFQYQEAQNSLFNELTESDFPGAWAIPIWYFIPPGENDGWQPIKRPFGFHDKLIFDEDTATGQHSGYSFSWSLENGVLTLERDNERFEYTASHRRANYFQVTVKRFEGNQLTNIFNSQMAKFAFHSIEKNLEVQKILVQDYPFAWGSTIGVRNREKYNNGIPTCDNSYSLNFFSLEFVMGTFCSKPFDNDLQEEVESYFLWRMGSNVTLEIDEDSEEINIIDSDEDSLRSNRIWQIVDFLDNKDMLVIQLIQRMESNNDGEFVATITQPDLVIYRRVDLSKNQKAWANTDSDNDGLSNPREQELGTDMLNADTDGDGISDGDEVANGTNPLRDNNLLFVPFDYDGDGKADVGVRRPSTSLQYILNSSDDEIQRVKFGLQEGDIPVSGDFDGDGIADVAVRRPSDFTWYVLNSSDGKIQRIVFGRDSDDIPVPADYDGDGITDVAVRRASNQMWYILNSSDGEIQRIKFGLQETDIPVPADYDGDGKADAAVRRASDSMWYILNSSDDEIQRIRFGLQEADIPVPADFDGDGKADVAVRRASNQMWYILNSSDDEIQYIKFGLQEGDVPIVADYDGDGKADVAVRRPSEQYQYIRRSSDELIERIHFGRHSGDIALAAPMSIKLQMLADSASAEGNNTPVESATRVLLTSEQ